MPASRYRAGFLAREANIYDAAKLSTRGFLVYLGLPWSFCSRVLWRAGFGREVGENISATKHEYRTLLDLLTQAWFVAQLNTSRTNNNF
jgi:hypothetical protein